MPDKPAISQNKGTPGTTKKTGDPRGSALQNDCLACFELWPRLA